MNKISNRSKTSIFRAVVIALFIIGGIVGLIGGNIFFLVPAVLVLAIGIPFFSLGGASSAVGDPNKQLRH